MLKRRCRGGPTSSLRSSTDGSFSSSSGGLRGVQRDTKTEAAGRGEADLFGGAGDWRRGGRGGVQRDMKAEAGSVERPGTFSGV